MGRCPVDARRADPLAELVPDQHLRDVELGAGDSRAAPCAAREASLHSHSRGSRRRRAIPATADAGRLRVSPQRGRVLVAQLFPRRRQDAEAPRPHPGGAAAGARARRRRRLDPRASGRERRLGRHPAGDGELGDGAACARLSRRSSRGRQGDPGDRRLRDRGGPRALLSAVRLADLGHGARGESAPRLRHPERRPGTAACRRVASREPDLQGRRLAGEESRPRARRLGLRVRERLVPGYRRHRRHPDGVATDRDDG